MQYQLVQHNIRAQIVRCWNRPGRIIQTRIVRSIVIVSGKPILIRLNTWQVISKLQWHNYKLIIMIIHTFKNFAFVLFWRRLTTRVCQHVHGISRLFVKTKTFYFFVLQVPRDWTGLEDYIAAMQYEGPVLSKSPSWSWTFVLCVVGAGRVAQHVGLFVASFTEWYWTAGRWLGRLHQGGTTVHGSRRQAFHLADRRRHDHVFTLIRNELFQQPYRRLREANYILVRTQFEFELSNWAFAHRQLCRLRTLWKLKDSFMYCTHVVLLLYSMNGNMILSLNTINSCSTELWL